MAIKTTDYVKFIRGTKTAFDLLTQKDSNTLYFISEEGSNTGRLYLGAKEIGSGDSASALGNIVIENVGDKQILYYDYASSTWINGSAYDLIAVMKGANETTDGIAGLVPVAKAGEQNFFLRGDGTWAEVPNVSAVEFDSNIFENNASGKISLIGFANAVEGDILRKTSTGNIEWVNQETYFSAVNGEINSLKEQISLIEGGVTRTIVGSLDEIKPEEGQSDNSIYMVPNNGTGNNLYDEYMVINGKIEQIGANLSGEITGYVKQTDFDTAVGTLEGSISSLNEKVSTLEETVSNLNTNFVTVEKYNTEVGNLSAIVDSWEKKTIVEQVDYLTDMLTWYEL